MIATHTDFVNGLRENEWVEQVQQLEQRATAIVSGAIGDLAHHDVVIKTVPFLQATGKQFEQSGDLEAAQQADCGGRLAWLSGTQNFP